MLVLQLYVNLAFLLKWDFTYQYDYKLIQQQKDISWKNYNNDDWQVNTHYIQLHVLYFSPHTYQVTENHNTFLHCTSGDIICLNL